ncbi:type II toxin-antitoxin system RelE/ParE family toxin [Streptomyces hirsutus]|uniref:type II toxin-antitoxin system RelE/ParE family toxin n=1 Tax=Streptomyces hirsutus TaxID=35620 RepID=UPI003697D9F6
MVLYEVELEPEVRAWLAGLSDRDHAKVDFAVGMLAEAPLTLGEPWSRHLDGKTRELRFHLGGKQQRITYWVASRQRIVLLTQFRKTKQNESAEVAQAIAKQKECEARHLEDAVHEYSRTMKKGE